jgi:hypothetical protein
LVGVGVGVIVAIVGVGVVVVVVVVVVCVLKLYLCLFSVLGNVLWVERDGCFELLKVEGMLFVREERESSSSFHCNGYGSHETMWFMRTYKEGIFL